MFELGFTKKDLIRAAWTFVAAAVGYILIVQPTDAASWKTALVAGVAAGVSAVKNLILADGAPLKG